MKYKDKPSMTVRPSVPGPFPKVKACDHKYRLIDSNTTTITADGLTLTKEIEVIFYCERCLDIQFKKKSSYAEGDDK